MNKFLEKIQSLPEEKRKIILWSVVIILGLSIFVFYFKTVKLTPINMSELQDDLKIQDLKEDLEQLPTFEIPNL
jgi:hypothetical protein